MINSMTGFGRGIAAENRVTFIVEIKSVNHRFQDISVKMPRTLISLEDRIRNYVKEKLKRGKIDIFITEKVYEKQSTEALLNLNLANSYLNCLKTIGDTFEIRDDISVSTLARFPEVITLEQKEEDVEEKWLFIEKALKEAISNLISMREKEGEKLSQDLLIKCKKISHLVNDISDRSPLVVREYKGKLESRLKELIDDRSQYDEGRVAMEIAIMADKASIDEEITRLHSHIEQIKSTLDMDESIGRKLDFIIQEMNREANTIGSKANDLEILKHTLELKSEIEKIREQVQNIQ